MLKHQGELERRSPSQANAFTVSAVLLSTCSVFAGEQHAIPAVSACNTRASIQPCEFVVGHAFSIFPQDRISDAFRVDAIVNLLLRSASIPQPTEWQHIGIQTDPAFIFAGSDFVNVHRGLSRVHFHLCAGRIERHAMFPDGLNGAPVHQPGGSRQLHRVHIATGKLCGLCFGFRFGLLNIRKIQPMALASNMVSDPEICAARFSITVDFSLPMSRA